MKYKYSVGADPELFIKNKDGRFVSAHNLIPGTKNNPFEVLSGAIQVDGTAAEFNIHPAETAEEFSENIRDVISELSSRVEKKGDGYHIVVYPTATYDSKYFKKLPPVAKTLGCSPDFNAWTGEVNPPPKTKKPFRTGGGHVHVGWGANINPDDGAHQYDCQMAVRQLDSILFPLSLLWDDDDQRRELYGKIGAYRPKNFGVEYRPLSNAWVADPDLHIWIFNAVLAGMSLLDEDGISVWKDPMSVSILDMIKEEKKPSRSYLLEYHDMLVNDFMIPRMPAGYLGIGE